MPLGLCDRVAQLGIAQALLVAHLGRVGSIAYTRDREPQRFSQGLGRVPIERTERLAKVPDLVELRSGIADAVELLDTVLGTDPRFHFRDLELSRFRLLVVGAVQLPL